MSQNDISRAPYAFISHSCADHEVVRQVVAELEQRHVPCWYDDEDLHSGSVHWRNDVSRALASATAVIWVKSADSISSPEVHDELNIARDDGTPIIPLEIEPGLILDRDWSYFRGRQAHRLYEGGNVWDRVAHDVLLQKGFITPTASASAALFSSPAVAEMPAPKASMYEGTPFALIRSNGRLYQLDAVAGLSENRVEDGDAIATGDLGHVVLAADGSVFATLGDNGRVDLWTLGAADALPGPMLVEILPHSAEAPQLLAVDQPLGQAIRVVAACGATTYSVMQRADGTWQARAVLNSSDVVVAGAVIAGDILVVLAGGGTAWASDQTKRPFALRNVRGVDAAIGVDGRYFLVGWGASADGTEIAEVVVEESAGWERVHRAPGRRAGIVRTPWDIVRRAPGMPATGIAVEAPAGHVLIVNVDA